MRIKIKAYQVEILDVPIFDIFRVYYYSRFKCFSLCKYNLISIPFRWWVREWKTA